MISFDIDLDIRRSADESQGASVVRISASGPGVHVHVTDPPRLARPSRRQRAAVNALAATVASRGATISIEGPHGPIAEVGSVRSSWLSRRLTGSRNIRLGSARAVLGVFGGRGRALPISVVLPPPTLFPLAPTVNRITRRRPTTTHAQPGAGRPRLIFVRSDTPWDGRMPSEFALLHGTTRIGSGPDADLQLEGIEPLAALIQHTSLDEYVLVLSDPAGEEVPVLEVGSRSSDAGRILRTGARVELGVWRMAFFREEFADHGRPFGGRQGGELEYQTPQRGRPTT